MAVFMALTHVEKCGARELLKMQIFFVLTDTVTGDFTITKYVPEQRTLVISNSKRDVVLYEQISNLHFSMVTSSYSSWVVSFKFSF